MRNDLIEQAISFVKEAQVLENEADASSSSKTLVESAANYYKAVYFLKNYMRGLVRQDSNGSSDSRKSSHIRDLIVGKIEEYETKANELVVRANKWKFAEKQQLREQQRLEQQELQRHHSHFRHDSESSNSSFEASVLWNEAMVHDEREEIIDALAKYKKATECYLRATKESTTPPERVKKLEGNIKLILDRVGELKRKIQGIDTDRSPSPKPATSRQHSNANQPDKLTPEEIKVLTWSSTIASKVFVPWFDEEARAYNYSPPEPWIDPDGVLKLSEKQKETFFKWKRPSEILAMRGQTLRNITMIDTITPDTIKQHCVSDCSFIAGLCISAEFERRFERRLITSLIHPQDPITGKPIYNPNGVYMVKLWFNGVERRVLVDDFLPVDKRGELLCSHTKNNDGCLELWVPILEKVRAHIIISHVCIGNDVY